MRRFAVVLAAALIVIPPGARAADLVIWWDEGRYAVASVMQVAPPPLAHNYAQAPGNWRHHLVLQENVRGKAVHRVTVDGIGPEQAVDEAIARISEMLSE